MTIILCGSDFIREKSQQGYNPPFMFGTHEGSCAEFDHPCDTQTRFTKFCHDHYPGNHASHLDLGMQHHDRLADFIDLAISNRYVLHQDNLVCLHNVAAGVREGERLTSPLEYIHARLY